MPSMVLKSPQLEQFAEEEEEDKKNDFQPWVSGARAIEIDCWEKQQKKPLNLYICVPVCVCVCVLCVALLCH